MRRIQKTGFLATRRRADALAGRQDGRGLTRIGEGIGRELTEHMRHGAGFEAKRWGQKNADFFRRHLRERRTEME